MQYNSRFASKNELASYLAATPDKPGLLVQKYAQTELPELPDHIAILSIYYCPALKALPRLPKSLTELWIHSCPSLAELPDFPSTMTILSISDCPAVEELPPLAGGLKELMLGNCGIKTLPAIPASLKDLRLNLPGIKYLPELPHSLAHLHLCGCSALTGRVITVGKLSIRVNQIQVISNGLSTEPREGEGTTLFLSFSFFLFPKQFQFWLALLVHVVGEQISEQFLATNLLDWHHHLQWQSAP